MPEGHVIYRLAEQLNEGFRSQPLHISSPQGRFTEAAQLDGQWLRQAEAVGKQLFLHFEHGAIVHIHLGLIGSFRIEAPGTTWGQIRLQLATATATANLRGPQWCRVINGPEYDSYRDKLGEDPLNPHANPELTFAHISRSGRAMASLLLDQSYYAGVGSIYRTEVLFRQRLNPLVPGRELSADAHQELWQDLVALMQRGVREGAINTVDAEHMPEAMGRPPRRDDHGGEVYVYRRAGQPCYRCGTAIAVCQFEGRKLFYCPHCQQLPAH